MSDRDEKLKINAVLEADYREKFERIQRYYGLTENVSATLRIIITAYYRDVFLPMLERNDIDENSI